MVKQYLYLFINDENFELGGKYNFLLKDAQLIEEYCYSSMKYLIKDFGKYKFNFFNHDSTSKNDNYNNLIGQLYKITINDLKKIDNFLGCSHNILNIENNIYMRIPIMIQIKKDNPELSYSISAYCYFINNNLLNKNLNI